ncbi:MAG: peptidylprolyl isomerase [Proteobacteria bacterium]|nr:peptidylprolyl isomerase [Pseudomonadota bacterium]
MPETSTTRRHLLAAAAALGAGPALAQPARPRVRLQTDKGVMVVELADDKAPVTVANYLRYVDARRFDGAMFFRASNAPGVPTLGFIQAGVRNPAKLFRPIAHESTLVTGLKHVDGAISMARLAPGTAQSDFTICCGDAPHMDAKPGAPGDNLGYAAFGQVVEGMEVARSILASPRNGPAPTPVMQGQMLDPPVKILSARRT